MKKFRICPICGKEYTAIPAISRKDNVTEICPECGTREALEAIGVPANEIEQIIGTIQSKTKDVK